MNLIPSYTEFYMKSLLQQKLKGLWDQLNLELHWEDIKITPKRAILSKF